MKKEIDSPQDMAELSKKLGLSRSTLSYILNDRWRSRGISEDTAKRVIEYVGQIGFQPNLLGRALSGKTIKDVAIILPPIPYDHHKEAYFHLLQSLEEADLSYLVLPGNEDRLPETARFLKMYRVQQVVVFAAQIRSEYVDVWRRFFNNVTSMRTILFDFPFERIDSKGFKDHPDQKFVGIDRRKARKILLENMLRRGYRRLILPASWMEILAEVTPADPWLEIIHYPVLAAGSTASLYEQAPSVAEEIRKRISKGSRAVAFIPDDKWAWSVVHELRKRSVKIPEDVAICSWDGLEESRFFSPTLATLTIPHKAMLAETLAWLKGGEMKAALILDAELREGESMPVLQEK